jgi:hypothetical protein
MVNLRQRVDGPPEHSHCNRCGGRREHEILAEARTDWFDQVTEHDSVNGADNYYVLKCAGCGEVHFRHDSWFSEDTDDEGSPKRHVTHRSCPPTWCSWVAR